MSMTSLGPRAGLIMLVAVVRPFAHSADGQDQIAYSTDVAVALEGVVLEDESVARDDLAGAINMATLGLTSPVDLRGLELLPQSVTLFTVDIAVTLPDGTRIEARDVVRSAGSSFALELDGSAKGIADGVRIDAVARSTDGRLLLSFDQSIVLGGVTADDEDLLSFDGVSFQPFFDGSARGFATALDLDAATVESSGDLVLSFDQTGTIDGIFFEDEDLLLVPLGGGAVDLLVDGSELHAGAPLVPADLDAVALPSAAIFADGFESGDTSAWSTSVGG